jgi:hypothetical protein
MWYGYALEAIYIVLGTVLMATVLGILIYHWWAPVEASKCGSPSRGDIGGRRSNFCTSERRITKAWRTASGGPRKISERRGRLSVIFRKTPPVVTGKPIEQDYR